MEMSPLVSRIELVEVGSDVESLTSLNDVKYSPESGDLVLIREEDRALRLAEDPN